MVVAAEIGVVDLTVAIMVVIEVTGGVVTGDIIEEIGVEALLGATGRVEAPEDQDPRTTRDPRWDRCRRRHQHLCITSHSTSFFVKNHFPVFDPRYTLKISHTKLSIEKN